MFDPILLLSFLPACLALNLTPGADMLFCFGQGLRSGPKAAVAASAGVSAGGMVHVVLAGLGLGALVAAYPPVFEIIRWLGVGYLLWLAITTLRSPLTHPSDAPRAQIGHAFRNAMLVNLTNPKVILFV
ncbi:MAG: LysE family translocator, partial [Pseudoruegeria sp.]